MKNTKIVCTIGPASESPEILEKLIESGMNVARLNFSHGDHEEHLGRIKNIREISNKLNKHIGIMLDTKGPEIRTHTMKDGAITIIKGNTLRIAMEEVVGTEEKFSITYSDLINDVNVGSSILLDDGLIDLQVKELDKENNEIVVKALNTGVLKNKKGVNVPGVSVKLPGLTEKDRADIKFGLENDIDYIAASFVRRQSDVQEIIDLLKEYDMEHVQIIPKIENQEGVDNLREIVEVSDGLMVARGDLGVEIPAEEVPVVQKMMIHYMNKVGKPVITATQMLDSMQVNPRPTRAEASDAANAIYDGTDAIMLSGETAAGDYPVQAVQTMANIATRTELALNQMNGISHLDDVDNCDATEAIGQAVGHTAKNMNIETVVAATNSGHTARMISKVRPASTILAVTFSERTARGLALSWGVKPIITERTDSTDALFDLATEKAVEGGFAKPGDHIIITAGVPVGETGTTNVMKIQTIEE